MSHKTLKKIVCLITRHWLEELVVRKAHLLYIVAIWSIVETFPLKTQAYLRDSLMPMNQEITHKAVP